jgi:hypothetical protein
VRPLSIHHRHDWRKMEVCLINFNNDKGEDDEGCLKFYNILKWNNHVKNIIHLDPRNFEAIGFSLSNLYVNPALPPPLYFHFSQIRAKLIQ